MGELSIIDFSQPFDNFFFSNIQFIRKKFNTNINKIIRISVILKNFVEVHYFILKFFIRGINLKTWK